MVQVPGTRPSSWVRVALTVMGLTSRGCCRPVGDRPVWAYQLKFQLVGLNTTSKKFNRQLLCYPGHMADRWLTARQQRQWRAFLLGTTLLMDRLDRDLREKHDLSLPEYEI